jgi:hypothetical protein
MEEIKEGTGRLRSTEATPQEFDVRFRFVITTEITIPGRQRVGVQFKSEGVVESIDGRLLPTGWYQLEAEDGEILRVKNLGSTWVILGPP